MSTTILCVTLHLCYKGHTRFGDCKSMPLEILLLITLHVICGASEYGFLTGCTIELFIVDDLQ